MLDGDAQMTLVYRARNRGDSSENWGVRGCIPVFCYV